VTKLKRARLQISRASLMLAVVRVLTANEPDIWGEMDSPTSHAAAITKTKEQLELAYRKIEETVTLADLTQHQTVSRSGGGKINPHLQDHRRSCSLG
jgi:hypothetical protein